MYSPTHLYQSMISDCLLVVVSVVFARIYKRTNYKNFQDMGTLSILIKQETIAEDEKYLSFVVYISKYFIIVVLLVGSLISIFSRLSLTMFLYLLGIGYYAVRNIQEFIDKKPRSFENELKYRTNLWKYLFVLTILFLNISYLSIFISKSYMSKNRFELAN